MKRLVDWIAEPRHQIRFWAFWTIVWLLLDPVTLLTPLSHSVPWINQESLFANFASCGTALVAAWSFLHAKSVDDANLHAKLDVQGTRLAAIDERTKRVNEPAVHAITASVAQQLATHHDHLKTYIDRRLKEQ